MIVISLSQMACGQKGDLYLPAIPEAPNVMNDRPVNAETIGEEAVQTDNTDEDKEQKAKKRESLDKAAAPIDAEDQP